MKEIHEKLAVWARLSKECEQLRLRLLGDQAQLDPAAATAQLAALQARREAAFQDASEAIRRTERAGAAAHPSRNQPVAIDG